MTGLEQRRRTIAVMDLLTDSYQAYQRGDNAAMETMIDRATELDAQALVIIQGGMVIGEIPNPERDWVSWVKYVEDQRATLAQAREQDG